MGSGYILGDFFHKLIWSPCFIISLHPGTTLEPKYEIWYAAHKMEQKKFRTFVINVIPGVVLQRTIYHWMQMNSQSAIFKRVFEPTEKINSLLKLAPRHIPYLPWVKNPPRLIESG
jgi:hypothetical protein